jgi:hypothetical protein
MAEPYNPHVVVVSIPGVQDILSIPPLEDAAVKRERLTRWRLQAINSPVPEPLRWIPQVINWLDNAQDFIITALVLGIPLLRRLPARFLPYLGWALLANDALNFFTSTLAAPLVPRAKKTEYLKLAGGAVAGRAARLRTAEAFLLPGRAKFIPFALQAGQVVYSFTGWGLKLGGLMGAITDSWWGVIHEFTGDQLVIKAPPQHDLVMKAANHLAQSYSWDAFESVANSDEIKLMITATHIATSLLGAPNYAGGDVARFDELGDKIVAKYEIISPTTKAILLELGFPDLTDQRTAAPTLTERPTYAGATRAAIAQNPTLDLDLAAKIRPSTFDWPTGLQATEISQWTWDVFGGGANFVVPLASPMERMLGIALETGVVPPFIYYPEDPRLAERRDRLGYTIEGPPLCGPRVDGGPVWIPNYTQPPIYPPPHEDPNVQLAHWCAIALALWCGRPILLPEFQGADDCSTTILSYYHNRSRWGLACMDYAAILIWGRALNRYETTQLNPPPPSQAPVSICRASGEPLPSLSGQAPELDSLRAVLHAFPTSVDALPHLGRYVPPLTEPLGRDWLDAYMRAHDPRRIGRPPSPSVTTAPEPLDSDPNPDDATRYTPSAVL